MILRHRVLPAVAIAVLVAGVVLAAPVAVRVQRDSFPHEKHAALFPVCSTCHAAVLEPGAPMWPDPQQCTACHDGVVASVVTWTPRTSARASNLRFTHEAHARAVAARNPADSVLIANCSACHNEPNAPRMMVQHAVVQQCLDCHELRGPHVEVASVACATCHVRLTDAAGLTTADIARFPRPAGHSAAGFLEGGHGVEATVRTAQGERTVAASCATCHARNLCLECHVDAPESPVIQGLALDARVPAHVATLPVPASHRAAGFLRMHGREAQRATATCATCHTQTSCMSCHVGAVPRAIAALPVAGAGRAVGARLERSPPASHTWEFRERHGTEASARTATCESCHTRSSCLDCHRPEGARVAGFHPQGFLERHPRAAYAREANCSDCHNTAQFCQSCHQQAGLVSRARLGRTGYHDAFRGFSLGHGQAARQSLESCVACHSERDCLACHAAGRGGFSFNPHGPGFNAARARSRNPSMCTACHGASIPDGR